jgi:hypothetical protein
MYVGSWQGMAASSAISLHAGKLGAARSRG